ncbi:MAG: glycosyltransferase family 39 protein [Anaerolineaceae bacterium]
MTEHTTLFSSKSRLVVLSILCLAAILLALGMAWISNNFTNLQGWESFLGGTVLSTVIIWLGWLSLKIERMPKWLLWLVIGAALLRLGLGAVWFVLLPTQGYQSPAEQHGYVMADAYNRDRAAWNLAQSGKPMLNAISKYRKVDQYGGLLYISATIYRYLGGQNHQPLLMVMVTAAFSSLAVLFTWAFSRRNWGIETANLAAWGIALFPEAVLLGSSQMREAFSVVLVSMSFYGLTCYWQDRSWKSLLWVFGALLAGLFFSPPVAGFLLFLLGLYAIIVSRGRILRHGWFWVVVVAVALLILGGIWLTWRRFAPETITNPLALIWWWLRKSADLQAYLGMIDSGWVKKVMQETPKWMHLPMLVGYGAVRPLLPAAISDTTAFPIWRWINIWRALGWNLILPILIYAPFLAVFRGRSAKGIYRASALGLSLVVWLGILVASLRAGADLWDNPRYRAMFSGLQVALAAWTWVDQRRSHNPWFKRVLIGLGICFIWIFLWYLQRYTALPWPVTDLFKTLGLGVFTALVYVFWDWVRMIPKKE